MSGSDPYRSFTFLIMLDGVTLGGFQECSGLDSSIGPARNREDNLQLSEQKVTGIKTYSSITLKRGLCRCDELREWLSTTAGKPKRKSGSIILRDETGKERMRWNFRKGWPVKWAGPSFDTMKNEIVIEELEIAC
ncbi:phage tail protein [Candidatus Zixiibacteriota bacterium]